MMTGRLGRTLLTLVILIPAVGLTTPAQISVVGSTTINAGSIQAGFPQGVTYHPLRDSLFLLDEDGKVTEINRAGSRLQSFLSPVVSGGGGIAFDPTTGNLLLASGLRIYRVAPTGGSARLLLDLAAAAVVFSIQGITVHPGTGHVWIADDQAEKVMEFNRSGRLVSSFPTRTVNPGLVEPAGIGFLGEDLLLVDDFDGTSALYLVTVSGSLIQTLDLRGFGLNDPEGVAAIEGDSIWIAGDNDDALVSLNISATIAPSELFFAQFGDGGGLLFSQILLLNPDPSRDSAATIRLRDARGRPLAVDLNNRLVNGETETLVPARGVQVFQTNGLGEITSGLVTVASDNPLSGVVLFGGAVGVAGVGSSKVLDKGFLAPIHNDTAERIRVGVAILNPENRVLSTTLKLFGANQELVAARSGFSISPLGREAKFIDELFPIQMFPNLDLSAFRGLLEVTADGPVAATVLQSRESEFVTLPVIPLNQGQSTLRFAHFGEGQGLLSSEILLINPDTNFPASATLSLRDPQGQPLQVDLNGQIVPGTLAVTLPARGFKVLRTDGLGPVVSGSVTVSSSRPLAGLILFGGAVGVAGVGDSPELNGFIAPMENNAAEGIRVGIAIMNPESFSQSVTLRLRRADGSLHSIRSNLQIAAGGREAQFLDELFPQADLTDFMGTLEVTANGRLAATVLQTRPGQFATMPVVPRP